MATQEVIETGNTPGYPVVGILDTLADLWKRAGELYWYAHSDAPIVPAVNTLEAIDYLDAEAAKASELAAGIISIGRDGAEFQQRAQRLRECQQKLIALNEILADIKGRSLTPPAIGDEHICRSRSG